MKIVKFLGGLGNQMFQYAFYLTLKQCFHTVKADLHAFEDYSLHNGYELDRVFGISLDLASPFEQVLYTPEKREWIWRKLRRMYGTRDAFCEEKESFGFDESVYQDKANRYYWGYWQNIEYVNKVDSELRKQFIFPASTAPKHLAIQEKMHDRNTVSVHVRRGDYLGHSVLGGICDLDYYQRAIEVARERIESPLFVFFSNDIAWCKEVFKAENALFVDWNHGVDSYMDMELMSLCRHHIIANSSFSWWGAWLNRSADKIVISPAKWVNDTNEDFSGMILPSFIPIR